MRKCQRKSTPFFQAMNDLRYYPVMHLTNYRYCSLEERNQNFIKELLSHKGEKFVQEVTTRFNQTDIW